MKRLQNRIAESGFLLPVMSLFGIGVWLLSGLITQHWWPQLACFILSAYLMVELNNSNALLRVRSRMVSAVFIALTCTASFMFASLTGALVQLFAIVVLLLLLSTYQAPMALGRIFYAFVQIGLASIFFVQILYFVPLLWLLMATQLQSLSWRGIMASLIGLVVPYWFFSLWFIYQRDFTYLGEHFCALATFAPLSLHFASINPGHWLAYGLLTLLTVTGIVHFWRNSIEEKIRIRLLYGFFAWMTLATLLFVVLQPQHYDPLMRIAIITASPLIAHFLTLTSSKVTNIAFFLIAAITLAITVFNIIA